MEADNYEEAQVMLNQKQALNLNVDITPIEDYYYLNTKLTLSEQYSHLLVNQTFVLFILEIRSGMSQTALAVLKSCILDFCEEALERNLNGFGFIINGEYFTIKKPNYQAIKDILNQNLVSSQQDDYLVTLKKLRHVLQSQIYKYDRTVEYIDMIFFTSYVEVDHSLGVKKRSYIDRLNKHSDECFKEVDRIRQYLDKSMQTYNCHVIGLEKNGLKNQDYSLADRDLYNRIHFKLGKFTSVIIFFWIQQQEFQGIFLGQFNNYLPTSYKQLKQGFQKISSIVLSTSLLVTVYIPKSLQMINKIEQDLDLDSDESDEDKQKIQLQNFRKPNINLKRKYKNYIIYHLYSQCSSNSFPAINEFVQKKSLSLDAIYNKQIIINSNKLQRILAENEVIQPKQPQYRLNNKQNDFPEQKVKKQIYSITSSYQQLEKHPTSFQIQKKIQLYNFKLSQICQQLKSQIISFKRIYDGNNKSHLEMIVDDEKQLQLKQKIYNYQNQAKSIYLQIFDQQYFPTQNQKQCKDKRIAFEQYSSLKQKLDVAQQVLMNILKKQIKNDQIGKISKAATFWNIRSSLKNKLVRRINLNPKMIDQTYAKIHQIVSSTNYAALQTTHKQAKHAIGYCIKTGFNFATALRKEDCLAILIQIQRPDTAIADPGRIKIRQISPFAMSVNTFFNIYHYGIDSLGKLDQQKGGKWIREYASLQKQNYQEMWDYWAQVEKKYTVTALVPVYLCKQHWQMAKLFMKPCLGWAATGQPLGYTFSQTQNIPFMVLSFAIRKVQQIKYQIQELQNKLQKKLYKVTEYTLLEGQICNKKLLRRRMQDLCWVMQETCFQIMQDLSTQKFEQKLSQSVIKKYKEYIQNPLQRTIDVISNNSSFFSQLYCVIKLNMFAKPQQKQFHEFFKRLVEEQLRRETDGWNQEQTQDKFINKLLNSEVQKMDVPEYVIAESEYYDNFELLEKGTVVHKTYFEITRNQLQMMITKNGKFNDTQRLLLIQYKRLYQNRVLWMWYVRFRLYQEIERIKIHKWSCIDLLNSYMLFTMVIQNKKQRKNYKRREAILSKQYFDPFNYYEARQFLQNQFLRLRVNKQKKNIKFLDNMKYQNAASTFSYTKSCQQAAGTLINFHIGKQMKAFFNTIAKGDGIRLEQKLKMLLLGQYKNVKLFGGWKMSKQKTARLQKIYPKLFDEYKYMF